MRQGDIVRTSYNTGPYVIKRIFGPCTCESYLGSLERLVKRVPRESEAHFHLTCAPVGGYRGECYLNGYRPDGTNVWSSDRLIFESVANIPRGQSYDLFADLVDT